MSSVSENYRQSVVIGWVNLLQLVVVMFVISLLKSAIENDFTPFGRDPGIMGMNIMIVVFTIYAVIPILVKMFDAQAFRWFIVGISIFFLLFFIAHQLTHMIVDKMPLNLYHLLDFAHHFIILWVIVSAIRWARCDAPEMATVLKTQTAS